MANKRGIRICDNDIDFLQALGFVGVLDTNEATSYYPNHKLNSVQNRLRLLSENLLVRATRLLVAFDNQKMNGGGGRIPTLYCLTPNGADVVEARTGVRPLRILNSEPAPATFLHRRDVSRVILALNRSCQTVNLQLPVWVLEQDTWGDAPKSLPPNQKKLLYHQFDIPGAIVTCFPDIACRLVLPTTEVAFFFEVDRSTEGHKQIINSTRIDAYDLLFRTKAYRRYWPDFSSGPEYLMWVCLSQTRINNLSDSLREHPLAARMRFSLLHHFCENTNILSEKIWQTIDGEFRKVLNPL